MTVQSTGDLTNSPIAFSDATANHTANVFHGAGDAFRDEAHQGVLASIGKQAKLLGEGVVTGAVLNPINAVSQLVDLVPGVNLPKLELSNQEDVNNSWAGKIGALAGTAADFVLTAGAVGAVTGLESSSAIAMGTSGAIEGGLLTPTVDPTSNGNLVVDRLENAAITGTAGAVMGAVAGKVEDSFADTAEESMTEKVKVKALAGAAGGSASGAVRAETKSILQTGELASAKDLAYQLAGGAMAGVAAKVQGTVNPSINDTVTGRMATSSIASATGGAAGDAAQAEVLKKQKLAADAQAPKQA